MGIINNNNNGKEIEKDEMNNAEIVNNNSQDIISESQKKEFLSTGITINLDKEFDKQKTDEYLQRFFIMAAKIGQILHEEKINVGEGLLVAYILERGSLKNIYERNPMSRAEMFMADNQNRIDMIVNMLLRQNEIAKK